MKNYLLATNTGDKFQTYIVHVFGLPIDVLVKVTRLANKNQTGVLKKISNFIQTFIGYSRFENAQFYILLETVKLNFN